MAKANTIQTNFTSGEITPLLYGRVDIQKYFNGAAKIRNFYVKPQGGVHARPGTRFVVPTKNNGAAILVPFEFSELDSMILEFGDLYIRFVKGARQIVDALDVPIEVVTPYTADDLKLLQFTQSADVLYITHPAYAPRKLTRLSESSWTIETLVTADGPYLPTNSTDTQLRVSSIVDRATLKSTVAEFSGGSVGKYVEYYSDKSRRLGLIVTFVSTTEVTIEPIDNILAETDPSAKVTVAASTVTSTLSIFTNNNVGAYIRVETGGTWRLVTAFLTESTLTVGAALTMQATTGVLTFSARTIVASLTSTDDLFVATDVGRKFRLNLETNQVWGTINSYTNAKLVSVSLNRDIPLKERDISQLVADGQTASWRLGAWSESTGYPSCVAFHEERLCFACSVEEPQTIWMSVSGDYENFAPSDLVSAVLDDSAITRTLASGKVNAIRWMNSGPTLVIGTQGAEYQLSASSQREAITPTNVTVTLHTAHGSGDIPAIRVGGSVIFIQRSGRRMQELIYDYASDSLVTKDSTVISEHIFRGGIKAIAMTYQEEPNNIIWVVLEDGRLAGLTYVKNQEIYAWHVHEIGGSYSSDSRGHVESIASIPSYQGTEDTTYVIVKRTINGVTKRYIEYISTELNYDFDYNVVTGGVSSSPSATSSSFAQVVIVLDTTGSMGSRITAVKDQIVEVLALYEAAYSGVEFALAQFKDETDPFIFQNFTTSNVIETILAGITASGGGDSPEDGYGAIKQAMETASWDVGTSRFALLFTDVDTHERGATYAQALAALVAEDCSFSYSEPSLTTYDPLVAATGGVAITDINDIAGSIGSLVIAIEDKSQIIYVDSSLTLVLDGTVELTGLDHLEGQLVTIVADGAARTPQTVTAGEITLDRVANVVTLGLPYVSTLQLLPLEAGASFGTAQGKVSRISRVQFRLYQSLGFKYGPSVDKLTAYSFRRNQSQMDSPPAIRTDDVDVTFDGPFSRSTPMVVVSDQPYPLNISAIMTELHVND